MFRVVLILGAVGLWAGGCSSVEEPPGATSHLDIFGFVGVACGTDLSGEVAGFTNVATTCAPGPETAELVSRQLDTFTSRSIQALLSAEDLLFELDASGPMAPYGGPPLVLRSDFQARWDTFARDADLQAYELAAVFVADEPTWRGVRTADLERALQTVRATLPTTPLLLVEAYPVLDQLEIPQLVDWVAFDRYGVLDPNTDATYLNDLATLKARRSRADQRVVLIMEAQWLPLYADFDVQPEGMKAVAESYMRLAQRDTSVIGLVGYLWAGGQDAPGQLNARDLPESVQAAYRDIGAEIVRAGRGVLGVELASPILGERCPNALGAGTLPCTQLHIARARPRLFDSCQLAGRLLHHPACGHAAHTCDTARQLECGR